MRWTAVAVAMSVAVPGVAAERPSFAGTWKVDVERSTPTAGGGRYFEQDAALADLRLVITQTADEVVIDRHVGERTGRSVFKLDGTETTAEGPRGGKYTARSRWDGDRLITEGTQNRQGPNGEVTVAMTEIRELAPDGKTLTVITTMRAPAATTKRKLVFVKVE
jgi:hypothetical protein